ncbi:hypothetical protein [Halobacterium zhouii]|uniref:hypothetical protein n=1 Tax=Halobacterium zhouii TaxID=2902624 RepID=UPI001E405C93|nr:hypothetical protein [Halobacterium zhouii]
MQDNSAMFDSFRDLDAGEHGADVGVHPDDIDSTFRNEDLRLVRVYRDDQGDLRRADGGGFVRNVVEDAGSDEELVDGMLRDVPPESTGDDHLLSALVHEAIPASFVRLDEPSGENVVTRVMALDVRTSKYDLLRVLGDASKHEDFTRDDLAKMEQALETLAEMDREQAERVIEQRFL